jgi:hypothetical protein
MRCRDATASSFVAKVQDEVFAHFHAVTVKRHSSICTKFDAVSLSAPLRNPITRHTTLNKSTYKISTSTQLREILYTDSHDIQVLSSAVASCCYNWCTIGSTNPGNYGYHLICFDSIDVYFLF